MLTVARSGSIGLIRRRASQTAAPSLIELDNDEIYENNSLGEIIGSLSTDSLGVNFTFATGSGDDDNASFTIDGSLIRANAIFDFETKDVYTLRVRATNFVGAVEQIFEIFILDVDEGLPTKTIEVAELPYNYSKQIWRTGVANSFNIVPPTGYTATWQIIESMSVFSTPSVVDSGSGNIVSATMNDLVDANGVLLKYDLMVIVTNGPKTFHKRYRRAITMSKAEYVDVDDEDCFQVIDADTYSGNGFIDFLSADHAGGIFKVKGTKGKYGNAGEPVDIHPSWNSRGTWNLVANGGFPPTGGGIAANDYWVINQTGAFTLNGKVWNSGDILRAKVSTPGQTAANWVVNGVDLDKPLIFYRLLGSNANPVGIVFETSWSGQPFTLMSRSTGSPISLKLELSQNVIVDGCTTELDYGVKMIYGDNLSVSAGSIIRIQINATSQLSPGPSPSTQAQASKNIALLGFHADGRDRSSSVQVYVENAAGENTWTNWNAAGQIANTGITLAKYRIENTRDEGDYTGFNNDQQGYPGVKTVHVYGGLMNHIGNEPLQFGVCYDAEVHDHYITNAAYRNNETHNNGLQIQGGVNSLYYRNIIIGHPNTMNLSIGDHGSGVQIFCNVFQNRHTLAEGNDSNTFLKIRQNAVFGTSVDWRIFRNLFDQPNGTSEVPIYIQKETSGVTTELNPGFFANNIFLHRVSSPQYGTANSPSLTNVYGLGLHGGTDYANYITTNTATPGFVDYANANYKVTSTGSAIFTTINTRVAHLNNPFADEDLEGVPFADANTNIMGPYSNYELYV